MKISFNKIAQIFSYKFILSAIIIFFTVLPSLGTYLALKSYVNDVVMNEYITDYMNAVETKLSDTVSNLIYRLNTMSLYFTGNHKMYISLLDKTKSYDQIYSEIGDYINDYLKNTIIEGVCIIARDGRVYNYSHIEPTEEIKSGAIAQNLSTATLWVSDECIKSGNSYYIMTGKKLYNYFNGYDGGYLIMYINENIFSQMYSNYTFADSTFFITRNGHIISHPNKALIGTDYTFTNEFFGMGDSIKINDGTIISKRPINTNGIIGNLDIVSINSFENFNRMLSDMNKKFLLLSVAIVLMSIALAVVISAKLLSEIEILRRNVMNFGKSPTNYEPVFKLNEIKALENDFSNMTRRITKLIKNIGEEKEKQKIAELAALQAQINPHFIYNTLDSVAWLALMDGNNKIYSIICSLANFFRISLNSGRSTISVKEEIEHVKNFVNIEAERFPNKFTVTYDIAPDIAEVQIIKIILQPLVENSIKHGFDSMTAGGKIHISGRRTALDTIEFTVSDNGCGFDGDFLNIPTENKKHKSGYGLKNINDRLTLTYGADCGLSFESSPGHGTIVTVKIKTHKNTEVHYGTKNSM